MNALGTHRKCLVCGNTTTDLSEDTCSCGSYMYMISQYYTPKIKFKQDDRGVNKKTAPSTLAGTVLFRPHKETPCSIAL